MKIHHSVTYTIPAGPRTDPRYEAQAVIVRNRVLTNRGLQRILSKDLGLHTRRRLRGHGLIVTRVEATILD